MANTRVTTPVTDFDKSTSLPGLKLPSGTNTNQPSGVQGMIRNDTGENTGGSTSAIEHHNGTNWQYFAATESVDPDPAFSVRYLVVAGGGGGGNYYYAGGGGAGGFRTSFGTGNVNGGLTPVEPYLQGAANVNYTVTVGTAGSAQSSGQSSQLVLTSTITTTGGGAGGTQSTGLTGGSGGGGANYPSNYNGGAANTSPVQGFSGGNAVGGTTYIAGAGGGGAGEIGTSGAATAALAGKGGDGIESLITGTAVYYAGGGGGGLNRNGTFFTPQGGLGGGGNGAGETSIAVSGTDGLGGGGGGGSHSFFSTGNGASGGSGVVILRYLVGNSINIISGTSPIAADLNAAVAGSTTEKFTRFTATGTVTFTIT